MFDSSNLLHHFVDKNYISVLTLYDEKEQLFSDLGLKDSSITQIKIFTNSNGVILHMSPSTHQNKKLQYQYINLLDKGLPSDYNRIGKNKLI